MREKRTRRWFVWALLCAVCLAAQNVHAEDPVHFADPRLREIVEDFLGKEYPTPTDMLSLTDLQAYDCGIVDLTGLEYAHNLIWLELDGNYVSDISALAGLTHLGFLSLLGNRVSDISSLVGLTNLSYLSLDDNGIADVSPLAALTNLQDLGLGDNQIGDISALSGLTNLEWLALGWNEVTDLSALSGMANLKTLELDGNQISDLSPLSTLADLNTLELDDNRIGDLTPLSSLTRLYELSVASNEISDLSPLSTLAHLHTLELNDNRIGDLTPLSTLTSLSHLDLSSNRINDLSPLLGWTNLDYLALDDNPLNTCAYCSDLYVIDNANPGLLLSYSANPNPPEGLSATDGSHTDKVAVQWIAPCEGPTRTSDFAYRVYRSISLAGTKEAVSDWLSDTFFDDVTASPGVHYWYWVKSNESGDYYSEPDEGWRSAPSQRTLTISSAVGGTVLTPGIGSFQYDDGSSVSIMAVADTGCSFTGWTGDGIVDADTLFVQPGCWADPATVWVGGDYHLMSQAGRWDPTAQDWVQDDATSPCIDAGDVDSPTGQEPLPDGDRINLGVYGGTTQAGRSAGGP